MKDLIIKILGGIISFINLLFNYKVQTLFYKLYYLMYSLWVSKQFTHIGKQVRFNGKLTLIGASYIYIDNLSTFNYGCILTAWDKYGEERFSPNIKIGKDCHFGEYNHITAINNISIGNGVLTGRWVTITDNAHGKSSYEDLCIKPHLRNLYSKGPVIIEDNVWIGDKVSIMPNVRIGKSSIIAANSVVTKDVPPFSVVAGIPAVTIKTIAKNN